MSVSNRMTICPAAPRQRRAITNWTIETSTVTPSGDKLTRLPAGYGARRPGRGRERERPPEEHPDRGGVGEGPAAPRTPRLLSELPAPGLPQRRTARLRRLHGRLVLAGLV